jgi:NAD(P)-dependent dehydrogenase (short-subunit alcohol dehydrogenase family)
MGLLDGRIAIVTGAARGNGAAIARLLASEGAGVALLDIDGGVAGETALAIADDTGASTYGARADVAHAADIEAAVAQALETFGRIDILVNNAGVLYDTPVPGLDMRLWEKTLAVNLTGPLRFIDQVAPVMIAQGSGAIVNITSIASSIGFDSYVAYCAAKSGLMGVTRAASLALAPHGVRVNALAPGIIHTSMTEPLYDDPAAHAEIVSRIPLGHVADAVEVAKGVLFLASDLSAYVTGTELVVDAGYTVR